MSLPNSNKHAEESCEHSRLTADVYFLIQRFLSQGSLQRTLQTLNEELRDEKIFPKRIDWQGNQHDRSVEDMERQYPNIQGDYLRYLCQHASTSLNSNYHRTPSFLSFRPRARNREGILLNYKQLFNYVTKIHGAPIQRLKEPINIVNNLRGRELTGPLSRARTLTPRFYKDLRIQRTTIGHLSAVYCLLFDHSGDFIITGADDLLIKMWSTHTARLIMVFRGASSEIADIAIDPENTLLAAGSLDKILRVWSMQTGAPIAVLTGQPGMITSVNFCPTSCWSLRYLISTGTDGSVAFWTYTYDNYGKPDFRNTPTLYQEKMRPGAAQMICSSFSPGGTFLATGSADHHVRVYYMKGDEGPQRILETEAHTDRVDSMQWAHSGLKFLSGSKDGTAIIWWFERQQWKSIHLDMTTRLPGDINHTEYDNKKLRVTMVSWDYSDSIVVTAVSDHTLKVWKASDGQLLKILSGHTDEVYVLESHPLDEDVLLSAGHDGRLFVWDVNIGEIVAKYLNEIEGQGHCPIYDAKWSPDGSKIAGSDSHGDILIFGFGKGSTYYEQLPKELFFHTDYRPLVRDQNYWVLDEQTQVPPHLMPPPFLVDMDGNPYPPMLQKLVPGRESCNLEQLVPNIVIGNGGSQEVVQEIPRRLLEESEDEERHSPNQQHRSQRIRQSTGNWQSDPNMEWKRNILISPLNAAVLERSTEIREYHSKLEMQEYQRQLRQRPHMISTAMPSSSKGKDKKKARPNKPTKNVRGFRKLTREELDNLVIVPDSDIQTEDSSGYSDWMEENERKERKSSLRNRHHQSRRKSRRKRKARSSDELETDTDTEANESGSTGSSNDSSDEDADVDVCDDSDDHADNDSDDGERTRERRLEKKKAPRSNKENNRTVKITKPSTSSSKTNSPKPVPSKAQSSSGSSKGSSVPKSPAPKATVNNLAGPSTSGATVITNGTKQSKGPKIKKSENYKLSEWLSETRPKKSPYFPQLHDEIVYFVQGHQLYVEAVRMKNVYQEAVAELPWVRMPELRDHEFCKVVDIKYQIKPPRLCCLQLAIQDDDGQPSGKVFSVRYHDMPDVLDFFVLKQTYTTAMTRNWKTGDKFRCMIDDNWWMGYISNKSPACDVFPDSSFMCYEITWTNGERERMSPWDMEPIDEQRLPDDEKAAIPVLVNELTAILYKASPQDWPDCERDTACKAISRGITQVMELAIAEPFLVPVDINDYPTYARVIEYPIDLSTIKSRFENNFYRRLEAAKYDIGFLKTNAEKFNEKHSIIIKHARILTSLCLEIAERGNNHMDIASVYHQLVDGYESPSSDTSDAEDTDVVIPKKEPESLPSTSRSLRSFPARSWKAQGDWKESAKQLLNLIYENEDSEPFQTPVEKNKYPMYYQLIENPIDLGIVRNKLLKNQYSLPQDFASDMRLLFQNSKTFNTNKRSLIYIMTVRLSTLFEDHMKKILNSWRQQRKRQRRRQTFSEGESDVSVSTADKSESADPPFIAEEKKSVDDTDSDDTPLDVIRAKSLSQTNTESDSNSRSFERPPLVVKKPTKRKVLVSDSSQSEEEDEYQPPSSSKVLKDVVTTEEESSQSESDDSARPRKSGLRQRPKRNRHYTQSDSDDDESLAKLRKRKKRSRTLNSDSESDVENDSNGVNGGRGSSKYLASPPVQTETGSSDSGDDYSDDSSKQHSVKVNDNEVGSNSNKGNLRLIRKPNKTEQQINKSDFGSEIFSSNKIATLESNNSKETNLNEIPKRNMHDKHTDFQLEIKNLLNSRLDSPKLDIITKNNGMLSEDKDPHVTFQNDIIYDDTSLDKETSKINKLFRKYQFVPTIFKTNNNAPVKNGLNLSNPLKTNGTKLFADKQELIIDKLTMPKDHVVTCYMLPTIVQDNPQLSNQLETNNVSETTVEALGDQKLDNEELDRVEGYSSNELQVTESSIINNQSTSMSNHTNAEKLDIETKENLELDPQDEKRNQDEEIAKQDVHKKQDMEIASSKTDLTHVDRSSVSPEPVAAKKARIECEEQQISINTQENGADKSKNCVRNMEDDDQSPIVLSNEISNVTGDNIQSNDRINKDGDLPRPSSNMSELEEDWDDNSNRSPLNSDVPYSPDRLSNSEDPFTEIAINQDDEPLVNTSRANSEAELSDSNDPLFAGDNQELGASTAEKTIENDADSEVSVEKSTAGSDFPSDTEEPDELDDENFPDGHEPPIENIAEFIQEDLDDAEQNADQTDLQDPFSTLESDIVDPFNDISESTLTAIPIQAPLVDDLNVENLPEDFDDYVSDGNVSEALSADEQENQEEEEDICEEEEEDAQSDVSNKSSDPIPPKKLKLQSDLDAPPAEKIQEDNKRENESNLPPEENLNLDEQANIDAPKTPPANPEAVVDSINTPEQQPPKINDVNKKPAEPKRPTRRRAKKESDSDYEPSSSEWESSSSTDEISSAHSADMSSEEDSSRSDKSSSSSSDDEGEERDESKRHKRKENIEDRRKLKKFRKPDWKTVESKEAENVKEDEHKEKTDENKIGETNKNKAEGEGDLDGEKSNKDGVESEHEKKEDVDMVQNESDHVQHEPLKKEGDEIDSIDKNEDEHIPRTECENEQKGTEIQHQEHTEKDSDKPSDDSHREMKEINIDKLDAYDGVTHKEEQSSAHVELGAEEARQEMDERNHYTGEKLNEEGEQNKENGESRDFREEKSALGVGNNESVAIYDEKKDDKELSEDEEFKTYISL